VVWAAQHRYAYLNLGALIDLTKQLKQLYIDTAHEEGFKPGPEHFGYQLRTLVADTDEKAQEIGRAFMWTLGNRMRGPREHNDPPGYSTTAAKKYDAIRPVGGGHSTATSYEGLQAVNSIIVGSPKTVISKLRTTIETLSPGYFILILGDGTIPHKDAMRSIELMGKEVIPALHEIPLQPYE
jgi:alkanesulfonate monooxygenase SsuD/methylene tetrahydromethanopterin reductase-like flavin-dependent oxidoreductase (luciferase family)